MAGQEKWFQPLQASRKVLGRDVLACRTAGRGRPGGARAGARPVALLRWFSKPVASVRRCIKLIRVRARAQTRSTCESSRKKKWLCRWCYGSDPAEPGGVGYPPPGQGPGPIQIGTLKNIWIHACAGIGFGLDRMWRHQIYWINCTQIRIKVQISFLHKV